MADGNKVKMNMDKNILDLFYRVSDKNATLRLTVCADMLNSLGKKQQAIDNANEACKDLEYCVERLVKGLASPRDAARLGYSLLLTEILKNFSVVKIEDILELMKKYLTITGKLDKRELLFGQLFAYSALIRSGRLLNHSHLPNVILSLYELFQGKSYILNASYEIMVDIFSKLSHENFKVVWSQLKKKLPADWENCSADTLWVLLLCIRLFPDAISGKYLKSHWGTEDIFASENLIHLKKIIKQTTATLPQLHPLCVEFIFLVKQRKDFQEIWTAVVDDLFDYKQKEKAYIGYELIKSALNGDPKTKVLKVVLSPKFRSMFSMSFLNLKHPMNPAANSLAEYLYNYVKNNKSSEKQMIVLKAFLQLPGTVLLSQILKKKEVSLIIQSLLPDAVKALCEILKAMLLKSKSDENEDREIKNMDRYQVTYLIVNLVAHSAVLADMEWRMDTIKFLFLNSFFTLQETNSEIPHCGKISEPLSDAMREACSTAFFKAINSLHMRTEKEHSSLPNFLEQLIALTSYADVLMNATNIVEPCFPLQKIQDSWKHLKSIVHKLSKQSRKDGLVNESNAFQALFLHLGLHLFQDPDHIPEVLEELHICCKNALKKRKHELDKSESDGSEPPWIGVVVDILLSLLSKPSQQLRSLVTYVFPLFCPFIDQNALQQILDVINPQKADDDMLIDESDDDEGDKDVDFGSGSSSDEKSDNEADKAPIDEAFRKRIQEALGPAADTSDAESVVMSDSEMFKLDDAISEALRSRIKSSHTQIKSEDKTLLDFRVRSLDLIMAYLKSDPPMHMVLMCIEPVLAAFELGHQKHQSHLLHKSITVLQTIARIRKFTHFSDVNKSELKRLLDLLIPKCHQEISLSVSQKLSSLCVFIVLCHRKIEKAAEADNKKSNKTPSYMKKYLSALDTFVVSSGSSHLFPQFFTLLMEACPDLAWSFVEPCKTYAFNSNSRLFKRTQCLGLLSESLKFAKGHKEITNQQWLELGNSIFPLAIEGIKAALDNTDLKPVYVAELLDVIFTIHSITKERTGESPLEKCTDLLPLLSNTTEGRWKKLTCKGRSLKNKIIVCLGGKIGSCKKSKQMNNNTDGADVPSKRKFSGDKDNDTDCVNGDITGEDETNNAQTESFLNNSSEDKEKKHKKRKSFVEKNDTQTESFLNNSSEGKKKKHKRKSSFKKNTVNLVEI